MKFLNYKQLNELSAPSGIINSIGIIGVSSNPGADKDDTTTSDYKERTKNILGAGGFMLMSKDLPEVNSLAQSYEDLEKSADAYARNGHTALFARCEEKIEIITGWDPRYFPEAEAQAYGDERGFHIDVQGCWNYDWPIVFDYTAISMEIEVEGSVAKRFNQLLQGIIGETCLILEGEEVPVRYAFKPTDMAKFLKNDKQYMLEKFIGSDDRKRARDISAELQTLKARPLSEAGSRIPNPSNDPIDWLKAKREYEYAEHATKPIQYMNCGMAAFVQLADFLGQVELFESGKEICRLGKLLYKDNFAQGSIMKLLKWGEGTQP